MNTFNREEFLDFYKQFTSESDENILKSMLIILSSNHKDLILINDKHKSIEKYQKIINKSKKLLITSPVIELVKIYSEGIAYAPNDSVELAKAYGNRSAILCNARLYEDSLKDIDRALTLNYPNNLKTKLYLRKAKNLLALGPKYKLKANQAITEARHWLEKINDINEKNLYMSRLVKLQQASFEPPFKKSDNSFIVPDIVDAHKQLIGASNAIELKYSEKFGRHFIATRDIKPGEILVKQRAYTFTLPRKFYYVNCWNCSKRAWSNVPCKNCPNVVFCDENCRDEAWKNFHDIECPTISALPLEELEDVVIMSLKVTIKALKEAGTIASLKKIIEAINSISDPLTRGFIDGVLDSSKYSSIYILMHTLSEPMNTVRTRILLSCATILLTWIEKTTIFGRRINNTEEVINSELTIFMGMLLKRNGIICATSSFEGSYDHQDNVYDDDKDRDYGGLLTCLTSFFNHSCDASARQVHSKDIMGIRSIQSIKKGEQIFLCYHEPYNRSPTIDRRKFLEVKYNFWCECHACVKNWGPLIKWPSFMDLSLPKQAALKIAQTIFQHDLYFKNGCDEEKVKTLLSTDPRYITGLSKVLDTFYKYIDNPCVEMFTFKEMLTYNFLSNSY